MSFYGPMSRSQPVRSKLREIMNLIHRGESEI